MKLLQALSIGRGRASASAPAAARSSRVSRGFARHRAVIVLVSFALGALAGLIELGLPLEDGYKAVRTLTQNTPADGKTVVVAIDDATLHALDQRETTRAQDAAVIETLFANGANRVFLDMVDATSSSGEESAAFIRVLERHGDRIFLGAIAEMETTYRDSPAVLPNQEFAKHANVVSLMGRREPFGLSFQFPTEIVTGGVMIPSAAAKLADYEGAEFWFEPDFSIDLTGIPTVSYIDILNRDLTLKSVTGRDVILSNTSVDSQDFQNTPLGEKVAGVYLIVVAAQTLREGAFVQLGYWPALLLITGILAIEVFRNGSCGRLPLVGLVIVLTAPHLADRVRFDIEIFPAILTLGVGWIWLRINCRKIHHRQSGLMRLSAFRQNAVLERHDVLALKIKNLASTSAVLSKRETDALLLSVVSRVRSSEGQTEIAFDRDVLMWIRPTIDRRRLADHLIGLHALFRAGVRAQTRLVDLSTAFGASIDAHLPLHVRVDNAIQAAEEAGKGGHIYRISDKASSTMAQESLQLLSDLDEAIEAGTVGLGFQPKMDVRTGAIVSAEALIRWQHAERGTISAQTLIDLAEEHNRIDHLTFFVIEQAFAAVTKARQTIPEFRISVNISAQSLSNPHFCEELFERMRQAHVKPQALMLEITETARGDAGTVTRSLRTLHEAGFSLSIDDFGTGTASIGNLKSIPSDEVKIDRSFISNLCHSEEDRSIVQNAIAMIHSLKRTVVAEGVEDIATLNLLGSYGCDVIQGYLVSPATTIERVIELAAEKRAA